LPPHTRRAHCGQVYLSADSQVEIVMKTPIGTKDEKPKSLGEYLEIAANDSSAGIEIFKKGGKVFAELITFERPGGLGKAGSLQIRIDSLQTVQGKRIAVKPVVLSAEGKAKKLKAYLMIPLLGYGFFVKGEHAVLGEPGKTILVRTARFEEIRF
jgi:hypothetical protein